MKTAYFYVCPKSKFRNPPSGGISDLAFVEHFARFDSAPDDPAIVYEQTGRNPPEILCVWSANP